MLNATGPSLNGGPASNGSKVAGGHSRSASATGRRSGEIIEEENEDEIEEVEQFSPLTGAEVVEEHIYAAGETPTSLKS